MDKLVFMHLPKTGGTTLHNLLSKNFNPEDICSERHNKLDTIEKFKLKSWIFFSGHYDLNSINQNISEPKKIITILREPKSRILSAYYFAKSHKQWFIDKYPEFSKSPNCYKIHGMNYKAAKENKLLDYLNKEGKYLKNQMSKWISGNIEEDDKLLSITLKKLEEFEFVGIMEKMDATIKNLFKHLNFPIPPKQPRFLEFGELHKNYSHCEKIDKEIINEEEIELLNALTNVDKKLYEYAIRKLEKQNKEENNGGASIISCRHKTTVVGIAGNY